MGAVRKEKDRKGKGSIRDKEREVRKKQGEEGR